MEETSITHVEGKYIHNFSQETWREEPQNKTPWQTCLHNCCLTRETPRCWRCYCRGRWCSCGSSISSASRRGCWVRSRLCASLQHCCMQCRTQVSKFISVFLHIIRWLSKCLQKWRQHFLWKTMAKSGYMVIGITPFLGLSLSPSPS